MRKKAPFYGISAMKETIVQLNVILKSDSNPQERRAELANFLMNGFMMNTCIICMLDEKDSYNVVESNLYGEPPIVRNRSGSMREEEVIKAFFTSARRANAHAYENLGDETARASYKEVASNPKTFGIITTLIRFSGKPIAMIILVKDSTAYGNPGEIFKALNPHIKAVLTKTD